jgi:polysaccharide export outer membrane protein
MSSDDLLLRPGDALQVSVWLNEGLSGEFPIEDTGNAYLPLLGEVRAAGVPLGQLRDQLRTGYRAAMQNPVVTIIPLFNVGIMGSVRSPGVYAVTPSEGLFDIIGRAGGFGPEADQENIRIVREGEVVEINALQALQEGRGLNATRIRPGDQIIVPLARDITFRDVLSFVQTAVTIGLLIERVVR